MTIGAVPLQLPAPPVSVCPTWAMPDTDGDTVFDGAIVTTALAAELVVTVPATFVALTWRRSVSPAYSTSLWP